MGNIDLFDTEFAFDYRWDINQNAKLLNIVYQGGTGGNFLKFFLDKFSKLTPDIKESPFTDIGTVSQIPKEKYSGLIQKYHPQFINDNIDNKNLPVLLISPISHSSNFLKNLTYYKHSATYRANDYKISPEELYLKNQDEVPKRIKHNIDSICKLYNIDKSKKIPKFIVRDWYKLEFLKKIETTYDFRSFTTLCNHPFFKNQNTHLFPLDAWFDFKIFVNEIKKVDNIFKLQLDFNRITEMQHLFDAYYQKDEFKKKINFIFEVLSNIEKYYKFDNIGVILEALIYAEMEKRFDFIIMPMTNSFFENTKQLLDYVNYYPEHYKAMNPNLPTFNGIPNPFYLHKKKK